MEGNKDIKISNISIIGETATVDENKMSDGMKKLVETLAKGQTTVIFKR